MSLYALKNSRLEQLFSEVFPSYQHVFYSQIDHLIKRIGINNEFFAKLPILFPNLKINYFNNHFIKSMGINGLSFLLNHRTFIISLCLLGIIYFIKAFVRENYVCKPVIFICNCGR